MIVSLTNHLWQSTLFVVAAGFVAAALRKNGADVRHRIWLIASLKFLVPFSLLMSLGSMMPRVAPSPGAIATASAPDLSVTVDRIAEPFTSDVFVGSIPAARSAATTNWIAVSVAGVWLSGFVVVVLMRVHDWTRVRAALRASVPVALAIPVPVRAAPGLLEPGVIGLFRPLLLVPAGIERHLTPAQMDAVVAHELCHIARHDNLTSALHMVVEAIFWFYPPVWWVGARLVEERERACDEHVLRICGEPQTYAESILNVCKLYVESPIACVSGVGGADLRKRVAAILVNRVGLQLSLARKLTLAIAAILAIALPLVAGMAIAPLGARAETQDATTLAERPAANAPAGVPTVKPLAEAQSAKAEKFDVVSVKPCETKAPEGGTRSGSAGNASPGYLYLPCLPLRAFVKMAYAGSDHPLRNRHSGADFVADYPKGVRGGPPWAYSDTFTIEATAEGVTDRSTLTGPMLRALLEDRFQLKVHRAAEQQSMFVLTVAKSGFKIQPLAPGGCWEFDPGKPVPPHDPKTSLCGGGESLGSLDARGDWLGDSAGAREGGGRLVDILWRILLRNVVDKTGLNARYSFSLEFTPDDSTPGVRVPCGPGSSANCVAVAGGSATRPTTFKSNDTIFLALEKVGLHLEPTKAPSDYLVIDHAERPKPNDPVADALPPARAGGPGASTSLGAGSATVPPRANGGAE